MDRMGFSSHLQGHDVIGVIHKIVVWMWDGFCHRDDLLGLLFDCYVVGSESDFH